jgi:hypothetical protein
MTIHRYRDRAQLTCLLRRADLLSASRRLLGIREGAVANPYK